MANITTPKVSAPVLWDSNDNFRNGDLINVDAASEVVGVESKPSGLFVPPYSGEVDYVNTLRIKEPTFGTLFLSLTLDQWEALIGETTVSPDAEQQYTWEGGVDVDAGCVITDDRLLGITILSINKGGATIYSWTHTDNELDLTASGCLAEGEKMQIIYKNA